MDYKVMSNNNNNYPTHHHWIPKMCECLQNVSVTFPMTTSDLSFRNWSYSSLARNVSKTRFRDFRRKSGYETIPDDDRQIEMTFHNVDESYSIVEVERNLRVDNLCELLRIKNQFKPSDWRIVETWPKLDVTIERVLENHEDIYVVHREGERFEGSEDRRFVFKLVSDDIEDYVNNPRTSFPEDMVLKIKDEEELNRGEHLADRDERLAQTLPKLCDTVWVADKDNINVWKAVLMVLTDRKLYLIERMDFPDAEALLSADNHRILFAHLSDYQIYKIPNTKKLFNAPFQWGACLRPSSNADAEDTEPGVSGLKVIGFNTEKSHTCWHQAMRLAKYGKQLKDNYRAFKNKNDPASSGRTYNNGQIEPPILVAMDFSGKYGKIVEDPKEAKAITEGKGMLPQPQLRPPASRLQVHNYPRVDPSRYFNEDWYHMTIGRESAARLVKLARKNGTFLVRESTSNNGYQFVLTYVHEDKPVHTPIITRETSSQPIFTLDNGTTKFLDLVQLVNFYQLNQGSLPTRLTYFVSKNATKLSPTKNNSVSTGTTSPLSKNRNSPQKISEDQSAILSRLPRS